MSLKVGGTQIHFQWQRGSRTFCSLCKIPSNVLSLRSQRSPTFVPRQLREGNSGLLRRAGIRAWRAPCLRLLNLGTSTAVTLSSFSNSRDWGGGGSRVGRVHLRSSFLPPGMWNRLQPPSLSIDTRPVNQLKNLQLSSKNREGSRQVGD